MSAVFQRLLFCSGAFSISVCPGSSLLLLAPLSPSVPGEHPLLSRAGRCSGTFLKVHFPNKKIPFLHRMPCLLVIWGGTVIAHLIWTLQCFQGFTDLILIFTITPSSGWFYPSFKGDKPATVGSLDTRPNRQPAALSRVFPGPSDPEASSPHACCLLWKMCAAGPAPQGCGTQSGSPPPPVHPLPRGVHPRAGTSADF